MHTISIISSIIFLSLAFCLWVKLLVTYYIYCHFFNKKEVMGLFYLLVTAIEFVLFAYLFYQFYK